MNDIVSLHTLTDRLNCHSSFCKQDVHIIFFKNYRIVTIHCNEI